MLLKLYIICTLMLNLSILKAAEVVDSAGFFQFFEKKLSSKSFSDLHPCKHSSIYQDLLESFEVSCNEDGDFCTTLVMTSEKEYQKTVFECSEKHQVIQSSSGDIEYYSIEEFKALNGNYVKGFLESADEYIGHLVDFKITQFKEGKMTMDYRGPNQRKIDVINIFGVVQFKDFNHSEKFILSTSSDVDGTMQILRFRVSDSNIFRFVNYK